MDDEPLSEEGCLCFTKAFIFWCCNQFSIGKMSKESLDEVGEEIGIHNLHKHYNKWKGGLSALFIAL